jgi:hypothetical protein
MMARSQPEPAFSEVDSIVETGLLFTLPDFAFGEHRAIASQLLRDLVGAENIVNIFRKRYIKR